MIEQLSLTHVLIQVSLVAQMVKNLPAMQETYVWSLGGEDPLEKGKATHSSIFSLEHPMDRGAWQATVYGFIKSWVTLYDWMTNTTTMHSSMALIHVSLPYVPTPPPYGWFTHTRPRLPYGPLCPSGKHNIHRRCPLSAQHWWPGNHRRAQDWNSQRNSSEQATTHKAQHTKLPETLFQVFLEKGLFRQDQARSGWYGLNW